LHTAPTPPDFVEPGVAYDAYAPMYDALLAENRINAYMRKAMQRIQVDTFRPGQRLLELGCGTGDEALALAAHGCEVVATDASTEMLRIAREKARRHLAGDRVKFAQGHARDIDSILGGEPDGSYDGAYSSFALSYERDLTTVRRALGRLLRPGRPFLVAATNRLCLAEWTVAMASLHPSFSGRRLGADTPHKVGRTQTRIYCRTPRQLAGAFAPDFLPERMWALPAVLPPHYMNRPLKRWPSLVDILERIDPAVSGLPIARAFGDHTAIRLRHAL